MSVGSWLVNTGPGRAAVEAGLAVFLMILPLSAILRPAIGPIPESENLWPALGISIAYAGYFGALLGAARIRRSGEVGWRQLGHELAGAAAVVLAIWMGALLANVAAAAWAAGSGPPGRAQESVSVMTLTSLAGASAAAAALAYPLCRGAVLVWPAWDLQRRTRLLWALTHAQIVGALVLAAGVAAISTVSIGVQRLGSPLGTEILPENAGAAAFMLAWVTTRLLPALTEFLVLGAAAAVVLVPPAVLISFIVLRRTTRRLEQLAAATGALRAGNLAARVEAAGEDEVGRLQSDFNAMAVELEQTLRDLQAERDRVAGLLESRRQLVAGVSHELRTPVATIRGYIESALQRSGVSPAELHGDLETIQREVARLARLIEDLFVLSRVELGKLDLRIEPVDAGLVVSRLVETMAPLAWQQGRVQMLAELPPDLPPARADADRLGQIVSNLLSNAVRHTPPGGLVAAGVSAEPDAVRIEVRDTGEGIKPDDLPHIFDRFYRGPGAGSERGEGAGLGLALVKELVEAMGGSIKASSTRGEGSCFTVRLPRA